MRALEMTAAPQAFPRCPPHQAGLDETRLAGLLEDCRAKGQNLHSLLLLYRGQLVLENYWWPYGPDRRQVMHSIAKSFTSAAIGLAVEEGKLALDDKVVSFFPEFLPPVVNANLAAMTVEDLLTMRSGHAAEISGAVWRGIATSWIAEFFKVPVVHVPGTTYVYSSACSYMLSAILTKVTDETLHDYLKRRLFAPLGIAGESWDIGSDGINPGGNGLTCTPMDLLKFGALYAQNGIWQDRRILPAAWIARTTRASSENVDPGFGYGGHWYTGPDGQFFATGMFGQIIAVFPAQEMVVALTSATPGPSPCNSQILPLLQRHLPGLIHRAPADPDFARILHNTQRPLPLLSLASPAQSLIGTHRCRMEENALGITDMTIAIAGDACVLQLLEAGGAHSIAMGIGRWIESETGIPGHDLHHGYRLARAKVMAGARWLTRDTLEMQWIFLETVFADTVTCQFRQGRLHYARAVNVNSGPRQQPALVGSCE